jgi:hypothetical protein
LTRAWSSRAGTGRSPASIARASASESGIEYFHRSTPACRQRALACRLVALVHERGDVEGGIVDPRLQDAVIEIEPVHLGADDVVVHLLGDRPRRWIDRAQPLDESCQLFLLGGHRRRRVVGNTVDSRGLLKHPPLGEERRQIAIAGA